LFGSTGRFLKALLAPVFKDEFNRGSQAFETFLAGFALAIGFRHLGAEGDEPLAIALDHSGVTVSHLRKLPLGKDTDKLKTVENLWERLDDGMFERPAAGPVNFDPHHQQRPNTP
jgi:hypothetical protein